MEKARVLLTLGGGAVCCAVVLSVLLFAPARWDPDWHVGVHGTRDQRASGARSQNDGATLGTALTEAYRAEIDLLRGRVQDAEERAAAAVGEAAKLRGAMPSEVPASLPHRLPLYLPEEVLDTGAAKPRCVFVPDVPTEFDITVAGWYRQDPSTVIRGEPVWRRLSGAWERDLRFLFATDGGRWMITGSEAEMPAGTGWVLSSEGSDPTRVPKWEATKAGEWKTLADWRVYSVATAECDDVPKPKLPADPPRKGTGFISDSDDGAMAPKHPYGDSPIYRYVDDIPGAPSIPHHWVSTRPAAVYFPRLLDDLECDMIVALASGHVQRSMVHPDGSTEMHAGTLSSYRTSSHTWLERRAHPIVARVMDRVAAVAGFGRGDHESMQVLRYEEGQYYHAHVDQFDDAVQGAQRALTVLLYLYSSGQGGATSMPRAGGLPRPPPANECKQGLRVAPLKGSALMFYGVLPNGTADPLALHSGCSVTGGEVWKGTLWLWSNVSRASVTPA
eukprot:TRINITY_DN13629_c1_g1_i1.p1 TRINITY_DN13629_c1_g1~~TRINITY_DN13629_c1_g1_i1.p1  ORF type:complete len:503 (+),score=82.38 TRINITY_DN13629_c1_g1_i1:44-1552(+)